MKKYSYISVCGTIGSGKTTAAKILSQKLKFELLEENFGENAFLPKFYKDMKRWAFHSQTFFLMEKIRQTLNTVKLLEKKSLIQDTPIEQDVYSYAKAQHISGNISDEEWRLYQKIYQSFAKYIPKPNWIIYLQTSMPIIVKRIKTRGRGYEQKIPLKYLTLLDNLNQKWLNTNVGSRILTINTDNLNIVKSAKDQQTFLNIVKEKIYA